jgi:rare lipoprotein A (peptidoglycan hydrolase)
LDCSYGAAKKLDFINQGTTNVKIEVMEWGDGKYMQHRDGNK